MSTSKHKLVVRNDRDSVITLWLEPWGEDYTMTPGESFEVIAEAAAEGFYFHIDYGPDDIKIFAEGRCDSVLIFENGKQIECGYGRTRR